jgi:hypothetical protein
MSVLIGESALSPAYLFINHTLDRLDQSIFNTSTYILQKLDALFDDNVNVIEGITAKDVERVLEVETILSYASSSRLQGSSTNYYHISHVVHSPIRHHFRLGVRHPHYYTV